MRQQHQHAALFAANEQAFKIKAAVNPVPVLPGKARKSVPELLNIIFVLREQSLLKKKKKKKLWNRSRSTPPASYDAKYLCAEKKLILGSDDISRCCAGKTVLLCQLVKKSRLKSLMLVVNSYIPSISNSFGFNFSFSFLLFHRT